MLFLSLADRHCTLLFFLALVYGLRAELLKARSFEPLGSLYRHLLYLGHSLVAPCASKVDVVMAARGHLLLEPLVVWLVFCFLLTRVDQLSVGNMRPRLHGAAVCNSRPAFWTRLRFGLFISLSLRARAISLWVSPRSSSITTCRA